jgi:hypothetical protein
VVSIQRRWLLSLFLIPLVIAAGHSEDRPAIDKGAPAAGSESRPSEPTPERQVFAGRVVKVSEALQRRGVKAYSDELKNQVALEAKSGELIPILPDWRGRAFFQDERLRDRDVELVGFRRPGLPYLNVMSVYTFDPDGKRQYTDYWCDICSIPMYEIKPCDCCQQEIRLRFQRQEITELNVKPLSPGRKSN